MSRNSFSPLNLLGALGAGGIAVAPFAIMQYLYPHPKGLVTRAAMHAPDAGLEPWQSALVAPFEATMLLFAGLHAVLLALLLMRFLTANGRGEYAATIADPLSGAQMLAPHLAIAMSFNVFIGVVRYFVPAIQDSFQELMLPALVAWLVLLAFTLKGVYRQLGNAFEQPFDLHKARFGWMLLPFALGMVSVVGSGIAAMAKSPGVAHVAAFFSLMGGMGALFLLVVKLLTLMQVHYQQPSLPDRHSLPSILAVVPILTVLAIIGFRLAHYAHAQLGLHIDWAGPVIVASVFAFQTFYLGFGFVLMRTYLMRDFWRGEYHPAQWGMVCPFVAWSVLGAFVGGSVISGAPLVVAIFASLSIAILLFFAVMARMLSCAGIRLPLVARPQPCA